MEGSVDFYATPTTQLLPVDHFNEPHFLSFRTSHVRQDVRDAQDEYNQYDRPHHYNPHSASIVTTPISYLKDDEDFVRSIERRGKSSLRRLRFLWGVVFQCCAHSYDLALRTWLKLLEGDTNDDIWLWVDGDEKNTDNYWPFRASRQLPTPDWHKTAFALSRRLEHARVHGCRGREESVYLAERRRRVQGADPDIRFSMIAWIVASSETMRAADISRGLSGRNQWDLGDLIEDWYARVRSGWFPTAIVNNVFQPFCDAMKGAGHTCHDTNCDGLKEWVYMRSLLIPNQRYDVVYLSLTTESSCEACAASARLLSPSSLSPHDASASGYSSDATENFHYQPPRYLVLLWILWSQIYGTHYSYEWDPIEKFNMWLKDIAHHNPSPLFRVSTLEHVEVWLSMLTPGTRHERWLAWVNSYPDSLRYWCTLVSSHDWERAQTCVRSASIAATGQETEQSSESDILDLSMSVNIRTWIGAVVLSVRDNFGTPEQGQEFVEDMDDMKDILGSLPRLPEVELTTAVTDFRCTVQQSDHTCYKHICHDLLDWYASAMSLTTGSDRTEFTSLGDKKSCASCQMAKRIRVVMGTKKSSPPIGRQMRLNLVLQELAAIATEEGLRFELPTGDSRSEGPSSSTGENPAEPDIVDSNGSDNTCMSDAVHSTSAAMASGHDQRQSSGTDTSNSETRNSGIFQEPKAPRRPKGFMIKEIKAYFIKLLEHVGVPILGLKNKQLPWTTLRRVLEKCGLELDNWPSGVPLPGSGDQVCDDNKGINGLDMKHLYLLYDAMKSETSPLGFRRIIDTTSPTNAVSQRSEGSAPASKEDVQDCTSFASNEANHEHTIPPVDTSPKRRHDTGLSDVETRPGKRPRMSERDAFN